MAVEKLVASGERFGRLTVLKEADKRPSSRKICCLCKCDCGTEVVVAQASLRSGNTKSCGCLRIDRITKHGGARNYAYQSWRSMKNRCLEPKYKKWVDYGGRGIKICDRWMDFTLFLADMGERPPGLSLERIDNNGDYTPDNCRWATATEQSNNRRSNRVIEFNGEKMNMLQWAVKLGMNYGTLQTRIKNPNWSIEKALTTPVKH